MAPIGNIYIAIFLHDFRCTEPPQLEILQDPLLAGRDRHFAAGLQTLHVGRCSADFRRRRQPSGPRAIAADADVNLLVPSSLQHGPPAMARQTQFRLVDGRRNDRVKLARPTQRRLSAPVHRSDCCLLESLPSFQDDTFDPNEEYRSLQVNGSLDPARRSLYSSLESFLLRWIRHCRESTLFAVNRFLSVSGIRPR